MLNGEIARLKYRKILLICLVVFSCEFSQLSFAENSNQISTCSLSTDYLANFGEAFALPFFYLTKLRNAGSDVLKTAFSSDFNTKFDSAYDDFQKRGDGVALAQSCADKAASAFVVASSDVEKYDALVLQSHCLCYVGQKSSDNNKVRIFHEAKATADRAKLLQPDRAEAYYYAGVALSNWAKGIGILDTIKQQHSIRQEMEKARSKIAIVDGRVISGKEYDDYGTNRVLGRMYFQLPVSLGGDTKKAEHLLREAVIGSKKISPPNILNILYLADTLLANGKKPEARQLLDETLRFARSSTGYSLTRSPETADEMLQIQALHIRLNN